MKLCVPELELPELVAFADEVAFAEVFGFADAVADDVALAECVWLADAEAEADDDGPAVPVSAGADDVPAIADDAGAATNELDVLVPHAARLSPLMMTATIAAGTRLFLMPQSSVE